MRRLFHKATISGIGAAGIAFINAEDGNILGCINKGSINGSQIAAAITIMNQNVVVAVANEGTIITPSASSNLIIGNGNEAVSAQDFSKESYISKKMFASKVNELVSLIKSDDDIYDIRLKEICEWSVSKISNRTELVFADSKNKPYYLFVNAGESTPYMAGDTVEFTFDPSVDEEGFVFSDITVKTQSGKIDVSAVAGKENTFSFVMPNEKCELEIESEIEGLRKDENGNYLVGTLDEFKKIKQNIDLGNADINIKLTDNIEGYDGTPIGEIIAYNGVFDGNGYSIKLAMDYKSDEAIYQYFGLFAKLNSDAVVKNLTVEGKIQANASYIGAVAGLCLGKIENCVNNAVVTNGFGKEIAKAGERITLTVTSEADGHLPIIKGVELDENNSFVMPEGGVKITAAFGDTFTGTDKSDEFVLAENEEIDEINLADYVKFENDEISRDFIFTLAKGNVLPDGLELSSGKITGTPTESGEYTVVFDVKDSGITMMSLDPDKALNKAKLKLNFYVTKVEEVTPSGIYSDKIHITRKIVRDDIVFTVTPLVGTTDELKSITLYVAEYDNEGRLINLSTGEKQVVDDSITLTAGLPTTDNYKIMLWNESLIPMMNAITNID